MKHETAPPIFTLDVDFKDPVRKSLFPILKRPLEYLFSLEQLNRLYTVIKSKSKDKSFIDTLFDELNVRFVVSDSDLQRIPEKGPLIVVANHPFGAIEGMILVQLLALRRPDAKIMANFLLERIPDLREHFIFVDPFGSDSSARANLKGIRNCIGHVKEGGALGIFPSGEVSHLNLMKGQITDPQWSPSVAGIIKRSEAQVVPIFFDGFNSALFQFMGLIHPRLRTVMLPHELLNKKDSTIKIHIGNPVSQKKILSKGSNEQIMDYLRSKTYMLQNRDSENKEGAKLNIFSVKTQRENFEQIVEAVNCDLLEAEVNTLRDDMLLTSGEYEVYCSEAVKIPHLLREIGRLREITFRDTNEGTGKSVDLDEFDMWYKHLFVWHRTNKEIVGAYRLGETDKILLERGKKGLYTSTLFTYRTALLQQISPALELGRSFVRKEYQKSFSSLLLLWRGIAHYTAKFPQYHRLFGPVSINNEYQSVSRQLMVAFLTFNKFSNQWARLIKAKTPFRGRVIKGIDSKFHSQMVQSIDDVNDLIADLETSQKGVPILLRQYLNLGGVLMGFNVDPDFSDVLDGLVLVDFRKTDPSLLVRYMGKENMEKFYVYHEKELV